jgi:hypothetical protein
MTGRVALNSARFGKQCHAGASGSELWFGKYWMATDHLDIGCVWKHNSRITDWYLPMQ